MLHLFENLKMLSQRAAARIVEIGNHALEVGGRFNLVLSGGKTPGETYKSLALITKSNKNFWADTHVYWGDERFVRADHRDSNYRMARLNLLDLVPIPPENIHPVPVDLDDPEVAAEQYAQIFPTPVDLILLGMGHDGHTASLFPNSPALDEQSRRIVTARSPKSPHTRITITPVVLKVAREVMVLVNGQAKQTALQRAFAPEGDFHQTPARLVRERHWFAPYFFVKK